MNFAKYIFILILFISFGCSSLDENYRYGNDYRSEVNRIKYIKKPIKIAILPINNYTTDVNASIVFRDTVFSFLNSKRYKIMPKEETDNRLIEEGISDGGQLKFISKNDLRKILDVDYLLYIDLIKAEHVTIGVAENREVEAKFTLFYKNSLLWQKIGRAQGGKSLVSFIFEMIDDSEKALKNSARDFGRQLLVKGASEAFLKTSLFEEIHLVVNNSLHYLPKNNVIIENEVKNLSYELEDNYISLRWDMVEFKDIKEVQILRKDLSDDKFKVYKKLMNIPKEINFYEFLEEESKEFSLKIKLVSKYGFRSKGKIIDIKLENINDL